MPRRIADSLCTGTSPEDTLPPNSAAVADHITHLFRADHAPVIAVLGAHPDRMRAAWSVPDYLVDAGAKVLPINPMHIDKRLFGQPVVATLADLPHSLDAIVVFRRSAALAGHLDELLERAPPLVWFQLGVRDDSVAQALESAGIPVVQDRCIKVDHARYVDFSTWL